MENLTLIKHLTDKQAVEYFIEKLDRMKISIDKADKSFGNLKNSNLKNKDLAIKNIEDEFSLLIRELSFFIKDCIDYKDFSGYINLAEYVVGYIKSTNKLMDKKSLNTNSDNENINDKNSQKSGKNKAGKKKSKSKNSNLEKVCSDISFDDFNLVASIDRLSKILKELLINMEQFISVDIYFYGEDKHNLMSKKFLKHNVYKLDSLNEVNYVEDNKFKNTTFKMLILGGDMKYTLEFNLNSIFDEVIDLNKINEKLFDISKSMYRCEYNYNYLRNEMNLAEEKEVDTLIIGNGYARSGIKESLLSGNCVNLSIYNQDIHYSFELAKKVLKRNPNIKKCIIGIGYYSSLYRLDRVKSEEANSFIDNTYKRLLGANKSFESDNNINYNNFNMDSKEFLTLKDYIDNPIIFELFKLEEVGDYFNSIIYTLNPNYFNNIWTREHNSVLKGENFELLNSDDKFSLGIWRANRHNKLLNEFSQSNIDELKTMLDWLNSNGIYTIVSLMPVTNYYVRFLDDKYKEATKEIVKALENRNKFKFIDFNEGYEFDDSDFIDVDHLNERGAVKLTKYLDNTLKWSK